MKFKNIVLLFSVGSLITFMVGCSDPLKPNVELIQDMMESPALKAQEYDQGGPNDGAMRLPPEGTQPVGFEPYKFALDPVAAASNKNPLAGNFTEETLKVGLKFYTIHCSICHGVQGEGGVKATVAETMALKPPPMTSDKINNWADGQIYHVITAGQGMMGPHAAHIPQQYRWQVVNYIRYLQGKGK